MDVSLTIKQRLDHLGLDQRDLARAARVTESYISQMLTRRRAPPAPDRTDIYDRMDRVLKLPRGELGRLARAERKERLRRALGDEPVPLHREVRELVLKKCHPGRRAEVAAIFERHPFGELERLVTQTLLELVKGITRRELGNEHWLRTVARLTDRTFEDLRVTALDFLDTDILHLSPENCITFLDGLIERWDIDLSTFDMTVVLHPRIASGERRFRFAAQDQDPAIDQPGFTEFLRDSSLSGTATAEEIELLRRIRFSGRQPTALYFYRELQSLRDPLHFHASADTWLSGPRDATEAASKHRRGNRRVSH